LHARSRPIERIVLRDASRDRRVQQLEERARRAGVPVERVDDQRIQSLTTGRTHGGVVAVVGPRRYVPLHDLVPTDATAFVAMLDGVEDPFNFGYAVRSLYAAGAHGLVLAPRNWMSAAAVVGRASAGASELLPAAVADSAVDAARVFSDLGLSVVCTGSDRAAVPIHDVDLTGPVFVVVGGEHRGVSRPLLEHADAIVRIPYGRDFRQALATSSAAVVVAFEVLRQRTKAA